MRARILIESGVSAGAVHPLRRSVVRIGSDPSMDITVPSAELESHALTLECRDSIHHVHNRCDQPIYLGGQGIASGQSAVWADSDLLEIPGVLRLALELGDEASPSPNVAPAIAARTTPTIDRTDERAAESATASGALLMQIAVIVGCGVLIALLLVYHQTRDRNVAQVDLPRFDRIVVRGLEQGDPADRLLLRQFQFAEASLIRGNTSVAGEHFSKLRSRLLFQPDGTPTRENELRSDMLRWVEHRLGQL